MECYACSNEPTKQCRRCARVYCEVHGGELCGECLSPASSLPSFNVYRGSLLALLIGTAFALWLIVRPPGSSDSSEVILADFTPTPRVTEVEESTRTPRATRTAVSTPARTPSPPPTEAPATPEPRTYVVQEGDTLYGIAPLVAPPGVDPNAYAAQIAAANGFAVDDPISPGQVLILP